MFRCRFVSPLVAIATREGLPVPNAATLTMLPASDAEAFSRRLCALRGPHGSTKVGHGLFSRSRPLPSIESQHAVAFVLSLEMQADSPVFFIDTGSQN